MKRRGCARVHALGRGTGGLLLQAYFTPFHSTPSPSFSENRYTFSTISLQICIGTSCAYVWLISPHVWGPTIWTRTTEQSNPVNSWFDGLRCPSCSFVQNSQLGF
jgi:hypothetical protein